MARIKVKDATGVDRVYTTNRVAFEDADTDGELVVFTNGTGGDSADLLTYIAREPIALNSEDITTVGPYAFYNYTGLTSATLPNLTSLGAYAFYNAADLRSFYAPKITAIPVYAFYNCANLDSLDLSRIESVDNYGLYSCRALVPNGALTIPNIGSSGCAYLGENSENGFVYYPSSPATLGSTALQNSAITEIRGEIQYVGASALRNISRCTKFAGKITGSIDNYGMADNNYFNNVDFSASNITSLGQNAFESFGRLRENYWIGPYMELDFRNSTFKDVSPNCFRYINYTNIYLPTTIQSIGNNAFQYSDHINIYMPAKEAPTLSSTTTLQGITDYKFYVPWNYIGSYQTATNWGTVLANVVGYAPEGTFTAGDALPKYNGEGYSLTWYTDSALTQAVSVCPSGSPILYCSPGTKDKLVVHVETVGDATIAIKDSSGNALDYSTYGYIVCDEGDVLTVEATFQTGHSCYIKLGGTKIDNLPHTFTVSSDVTLRAVDYDPTNINADFVAATWRQIKNAVDSGVAVSLYADCVGLTKEVNLKDGQTVHVRLSNNTTDMYDYADGNGKTGFCLEFVECLETRKRMNATAVNTGGWNDSEMRTVTMPEIYDLLPADLQEVIATVITKACSVYNDNTIVESEDKLFLLAEREIFGTIAYSRSAEWNILSRWQYYADHDTSDARTKRVGSSASWWWERSVYSGYQQYFCFVYSNGVAGSRYQSGTASNAGGVSPGFCI